MKYICENVLLQALCKLHPLLNPTSCWTGNSSRWSLLLRFHIPDVCWLIWEFCWFRDSQNSIKIIHFKWFICLMFCIYQNHYTIGKFVNCVVIWWYLALFVIYHEIFISFQLNETVIINSLRSCAVC